MLLLLLLLLMAVMLPLDAERGSSKLQPAFGVHFISFFVSIAFFRQKGGGRGGGAKNMGSTTKIQQTKNKNTHEKFLHLVTDRR